MRRMLVGMALLAALAVAAVVGRHGLMVAAVRLAGTPALLDPADEGPGTRWADDYFTVHALDAHTFVIPGPLFAFLPNSGIGDYLVGAENVLAAAPADSRVYAAHRLAPPGVPEVRLGDVVELWANPAWLQRWDPSPLGGG